MKDTRVSQSALKKTTAGRGTSGFNVLCEGVVVGIHYPDDQENRSKIQVEYVVDITTVYNLGRLDNVPRVDVAAGIDDGDDNILRVANNNVGEGAFVNEGSKGNKPTPRLKTDGDRVVVGFINGNPNRPVIMGVLPHFAGRMRESGKALKTVDGQSLPKKPFRRTRHQGTEMVTDEKGNVTIVFGKGHDEKGKDTDDKKKVHIVIGDLEVNIDNTSSPTKVEFKLKDGNSIATMTKNDFKLGAADEPMVLGNKLKTFLNDFLTAYNAHMHTGNFGAPTPMIPDSMVSKASELPNLLSDWAKVSKAKP